MNSISNREQNNETCADCGSKSYKMIVSAVKTVSSVSSQHKHPSWFKDKMQEVKKHVGHTGSKQFQANT